MAPACNVTVISQRFQPHFTKSEPQQKPVIIMNFVLNDLLLITPGENDRILRKHDVYFTAHLQ